MPEFFTQRSNILLLLLGVFIVAALISYTQNQTQDGDKASQAHISAENKAADFSFAPHKALYDIRLSAKRSGSQIVNISGQMLYDWHPSCDAWLSNHRFNMVYEYADSSPMRIASNFSTFEGFDGKSLNYSSQRKRNGEIFEELRGFAELDGKKGGNATYTLPADLSYELPEGALFPMAHTMEVARQIQNKAPFYSAVIFDGSDEEGPVEVNSFIGGPASIEGMFEDVGKDFDLSLLESPAHKVRLAFFPLNNQQETADYEMDLIFHENGVISDMVIEYDDFTVVQKLVALEKTDTGCDSPKKKVLKGEENR